MARGQLCMARGQLCMARGQLCMARGQLCCLQPVLASCVTSHINQSIIVSSSRDGLVAAVMLCKQNVMRSSPDKILQFLCKRKVECPDYPEDLQHWISFISASSQALRAQSGLEDKTGPQEDKDK
nr:protein THEM6 [Oncorhynchus nerka]